MEGNILGILEIPEDQYSEIYDTVVDIIEKHTTEIELSTSNILKDVKGITKSMDKIKSDAFMFTVGGCIGMVISLHGSCGNKDELIAYLREV